jgi:bifunctional DNA-binding transcriptional regulator/antitoxin component of YhaV-PrlF toxin-antitoxin module
MALLRRRTHLPDDVRRRLVLAPGDRLIAFAELTDGWVVASVHRLHVVREGADVLARPWSDVDGARLDPATSELVVTWVDGSPASVLALADDRSTALPRAVHDRVQSSVVHSERVPLLSGSVVRVALRRHPDGTLLTQVIGTGDVDLADPVTAAAVDAAEARVREAAGLA